MLAPVVNTISKRAPLAIETSEESAIEPALLLFQRAAVDRGGSGVGLRAAKEYHAAAQRHAARSGDLTGEVGEGRAGVGQRQRPAAEHDLAGAE
jgi:hypothetical protein